MGKPSAQKMARLVTHPRGSTARTPRRRGKGSTEGKVVRRGLAYGLLALGLCLGFVACNTPPQAEASVVCEHRGMKHIERHGGKLVDDQYHRSHHERPTCDPDDKDKGIEDKADERERANDRVRESLHGDNRDTNRGNNRFPRRDHKGFHCTWRGCG